MTMQNLCRGMSHLGLLLAAACLVVAGSPFAQAGSISYSLTLCEDLDVLRDPTNQLLSANAGLKPQHTLLSQRTSPYIELRNTSEDSLITQMTLSIGDTSKNFDWGKLIEASPGVKFTLASADAVAGGAKTDLLVIKFDGLKAGDFVRFRVGISADDPSQGLLFWLSQGAVRYEWHEPRPQRRRERRILDGNQPHHADQGAAQLLEQQYLHGDDHCLPASQRLGYRGAVQADQSEQHGTAARGARAGQCGVVRRRNARSGRLAFQTAAGTPLGGPLTLCLA